LRQRACGVQVSERRPRWPRSARASRCGPTLAQSRPRRRHAVRPIGQPAVGALPSATVVFCPRQRERSCNACPTSASSSTGRQLQTMLVEALGLNRLRLGARPARRPTSGGVSLDLGDGRRIEGDVLIGAALRQWRPARWGQARRGGWPSIRAGADDSGTGLLVRRRECPRRGSESARECAALLRMFRGWPQPIERLIETPRSVTAVQARTTPAPAARPSSRPSRTRPAR
jgi:hypothetical protein